MNIYNIILNEINIGLIEGYSHRFNISDNSIYCNTLIIEDIDDNIISILNYDQIEIIKVAEYGKNKKYNVEIKYKL